MTSPVSRDSLVAIRAELYPWADPGLRELLAAAAYALDADDRIAALEAALRRMARQQLDDWAEERDALRERIAALEAERDKAQREADYEAGGWDAADAQQANVNRLTAERDALAAIIAKVRALCEMYRQDVPWVIPADDLLAILDGEAP